MMKVHHLWFVTNTTVLFMILPGMCKGFHTCNIDCYLVSHMSTLHLKWNRNGFKCRNLYSTHVPIVDEGAVKALKQLRLTADDFEVKGIIGRGHFGEVMDSPLSHKCAHQCACKYVHYWIIMSLVGVSRYTVEPLTTDSLYYGNLHNTDKRLRSQIIPYSLLYIATSV